MNRAATPPAMLTALLVAVTVACVAGSSAGGETPAAPSLREAMAKLKGPPGWFDSTPVKWDANKPWKDGWVEIRRLLALGDEVSNREAVKLTVLYARKGDIGDGHLIQGANRNEVNRLDDADFGGVVPLEKAG